MSIEPHGEGRAASPIRTRRFRLGELEISCDEVGSGGEPLIFIHGLTGHRADFREPLETLARDGATWALAPDLRGHGDATPVAPDDYSFSHAVADLEELLDALEVERCHLLGHSMGGMVSLRFVLTHPDRIASLILMCTSPSMPEGPLTKQVQRVSELALAMGMEELQQKIEAASRNPDRGPPDPHIDAWGGRYWPHHRLRYNSMDPAGLAGLGRAMCEQDSIEARLGEIQAPTLVLVGEGDSDFFAAADTLERGIHGCTRVTIPEAGHHPHQENSRAWYSMLREHLEKVNDQSTS